MIPNAESSVSSLHTAYDRFAEWFQTLSTAYYEPRKTELLADFIKNKKGERISILDCACGLGMAAIDLAKSGFQVTGSDASKEMLNYARSNATREEMAVTFQQCDWRELESKVKGTFDCVINLGVNIYHLKGQELFRALQGMKQKLAPNGLLLIDNKNWHPLLQANNGSNQIRYIEKRPPIRVYWPHALKAKDDDSRWYFFDVSWLNEDRWVIEVIRLPADKVCNAIRKDGRLVLDIHGLPVICTIEDDDKFTALISDAVHEVPDKEFPVESIAIIGWPIPSAEIARLLDQIGMQDIKIVDRAEALYKDNKEAEKRNYDLIIASTPS